jgi:hypothetical protein
MKKEVVLGWHLKAQKYFCATASIISEGIVRNYIGN